MTNAISQEITQRKEKERNKALEKYGPTALQPGGRPEFDVLDYAINEVIGLERYGQMIEHRYGIFPGSGEWSEVFDELRAMGTALQYFSIRVAPNMIRLRQKLQSMGLTLGEEEVR